MKIHHYQSLVVLAAIGFSMQAGLAADSLAPAGYLAPGSGSESGIAPSAVVAPAAPVGEPGSFVTEAAVAPSPVTVANTPNQDFANLVASGGENNNPGGPAPLVIPEPTTLALTGFCGLAALMFLRRVGKTNRA